MIDLASRNLIHDKFKLLITVLGVAFSVTLVFVQMGLFLGLLDNATLTIERLPADIWVVGKGTGNVDFGSNFSDSLVYRVRSVPGVAFADNLIVTFMDLVVPTGAVESSIVYALNNFDRWQFPWNILEGSISDLQQGPCVFVDMSAIRRFGPFVVGDYREFQGRRLKIAGRTEGALSFTTTPLSFMGYRTAQLIQPHLVNKTTYILVRLERNADPAAVRAEIQRQLPTNDVLTSTEWASKTRNYWIESTGLGLNMLLTVFLGGLVGLVVVAQTLYSSTMEHLAEFGTLKAIGGSNRIIYAITARQALICALGGFVVGLLPTTLATHLIPLFSLKLSIPPSLWLTVLIGTLLMCLGAATISFRRIAAIDPAMVFRS